MSHDVRLLLYLTNNFKMCSTLYLAYFLFHLSIECCHLEQFSFLFNMRPDIFCLRRISENVSKFICHISSSLSLLHFERIGNRN